jgi:subtilisin family serine protease
MPSHPQQERSMPHRQKLFLALALAFGVTACGDAVVPTQPMAEPHASARLSAPGTNSWIVVFRNDVTDVTGLAHALTKAHGGTLQHTYRHAIRGFAARLPDGAVQALSSHSSVAYVEADQPVHTFSTTQTNATWGLDRIDQRNLPLSATYTYENSGGGVRAYIIDTGIRRTHNEFGTRANTTGFTAINDGRGTDDCNGHGTHVAGTVGGTVYGVAKGVTLIAVRVLDCNGSGTIAGVIAGLDWVTANHVKPAVANMSLGGGASTTLDDAVRNSIAAGVSYAVAAGNGDFLGRQQNACNYSPARVAEAITTGASNSTDAKASWSNYGNCVDIFAPGVNIASAWHSSNTATNTISGTSMAAPHVAGVAALYLAVNTGASPAAVKTAIHDNSTKNKITNSSTTNNHLLYSLFGGAQPPPVNQPPTASFTYSCTDLTCNFTDTSTDPDGLIASRSWNFGDGTSSTATNPSRTYSASGTYTVTLTVTDNGGATANTSQSVPVSGSSGSTFVLTGSGTKAQGVNHAQLSWTGAPSGTRTVYQNGSSVGTTSADTFTHNTGTRGGRSFDYYVCVGSTCSNTITLTW